MTEPPVFLNDEQRRIVEDMIVRHCRIRNWILHVCRCGTNHVHVVVTAKCDPQTVMDQLKAWGTRLLKLTEPGRMKWWTEGGSKRRLYGQTSLEEAIRYVAECQ
jgi:hypothetical protein